MRGQSSRKKKTDVVEEFAGYKNYIKTTHNATVLSPEVIKEIRYCYFDLCQPMRKIAQHYGIGLYRVFKIIHNIYRLKSIGKRKDTYY